MYFNGGRGNIMGATDLNDFGIDIYSQMLYYSVRLVEVFGTRRMFVNDFDNLLRHSVWDVKLYPDDDDWVLRFIYNHGIFTVIE